MQFRRIKYIHIAVQPQFPELFSSYETNTLYLLNITPLSPPPQSLATSMLLPVSMILRTLGTSYK